MKTTDKVITLAIAILFLLTTTSTAFAQNLFALPSGFSEYIGFQNTGAARQGYYRIYVTAPNRLASTKAELQDNAGVTIDVATSAKSSSFAEALVDNKTGDLGRIVLFCTFNAWVGSTAYVEYKMAESLN